jgi:hypothetical protein
MDKDTLMTIARFWNKVKIVPESNSDACWEWQGGKLNNRNGQNYGIASIGKSKTELAHRFVARLTEDIDNQVVQHRCDNPLCVRPDHLVVGDQKQNMQDMYRKGRANVKLDRVKVLDIRSRMLSRAEYAKKYNVSEYTIGEVQRGTTWDWV